MFSCFCNKRGSWTLVHPFQNKTKSTSVSPQNGTQKEQPIVTPIQITKSPSAIIEDSKGSDDEDSYNSRRRSGLAGQPVNVDEQELSAIEIKRHSKTKSDEDLIKKAITENEFLNHVLQGKRLQEVVNAMYSREVTANEDIIIQGSVGTQLFVSASGTYQVSINEEIVLEFNDKRVFGELAILYNAKRQASVKPLTRGQVWVLDQEVYQKLMLITDIGHRDEMLTFLQNVPKLNTVSKHVLGKVTDLLKSEFFATGEVIIRQGDHGDKFYIVGAGSVTVTREDEGEVGKLCRGEFFGQLALLNDDVRQATVTADAPGVECFSLSRPDFITHFGSVDDIEIVKERKQTSAVVNPYQNIELKDLKRINTLGVGGFGRVELVQHKTQKEFVFALKYLKKIDMIQQEQQEHTFNEKIIQLNCNTIFIVRMYKTMKDNKYLYFLMEACLGGDLWSLLQKQKGRRLDEVGARFYAASALEALAYLHERSIVYRDLKPENLLLDPKGNLKLTDFGFAKKLGARGRTYTFAGTPEYVAPEIVLNRGHDLAVDYWALGIFIYELLVGKTPFRTNDPTHMKTYNLILRGIENVRFPEILSRKAEHLIKKLCRAMPVERLGCQREGIQAIREHRWFTGLDWNLLQTGQLRPPIKRNIISKIDTQHFEKFQNDTDIPPDQLSGWDDF
ncbi:hypothetical protein FQA39_LY11010 [Lamprigera yunnana]|nr:hypothetical protein FQA39_LY11010 [Lamprigera yunnana]